MEADVTIEPLGGAEGRSESTDSAPELSSPHQRLAIVDVQPTEPLLSSTQFTLRLTLDGMEPSPGIARVVTFWDGSPFVVEQTVSLTDYERGYCDVPFSAEQSLPAGRVTFSVALITETGDQANFRLRSRVLPAKSLELTLSALSNFLTGVTDARAVKIGENFVVDVGVTLSNGQESRVDMRPEVAWEFWDGPVGSGAPVQHGVAHVGEPVTIQGLSTWRGSLHFVFAPGTGVYRKLSGREDLTLRTTMVKTTGRVVRATIPVRTMFVFGLNIIRVGDELYSPEEYADLYDAVELAQSMYEQIAITFAVERLNLPVAWAEPFLTITSMSEVRVLRYLFSGPDNDYVDVFIVPSLLRAGFLGTSPMPGPTSHSGWRSGVAVDRMSAGIHGRPIGRLNVETLASAIAHEVGHYLGIDHLDEEGNVMRPYSDSDNTVFNYPQYRTMIRHGWIRRA